MHPTNMLLALLELFPLLPSSDGKEEIAEINFPGSIRILKFGKHSSKSKISPQKKEKREVKLEKILNFPLLETEIVAFQELKKRFHWNSVAKSFFTIK